MSINRLSIILGILLMLTTRFVSIAQNEKPFKVVKTTFMFSTSLSASIFVQYNSDTDEVVSNFRLRYNPKEGNDLYIVYNDNINTDRLRKLPILPIYSVRAFVIKYTYTFTWVR